MKNSAIDSGKAFDWGKTSTDYAKYRDIYPQEFYEKIVSRGLCLSGQTVLDLGTGTGVLPRNMYRYGAKWTGADISPQQIEQARQLSAEAGMKIDYVVSPAEELSFPDGSFDVITACQCHWYFDYERLIPRLARMLKAGGALVLLCMEWLPFEDKIAGASEELVLKYSPNWSGAGQTVKPISVPDCVFEHFDAAYSGEYLLDVPFTAEAWNGRMKACRGVGASLTEEETAAWETEHRRLLAENAPERFTVKHYAAILELRKK